MTAGEPFAKLNVRSAVVDPVLGSMAYVSIVLLAGFSMARTMPCNVADAGALLEWPELAAVAAAAVAMGVFWALGAAAAPHPVATIAAALTSAMPAVSARRGGRAWRRFGAMGILMRIRSN